MSWRVHVDQEERNYDTREEALARAWELTPAGGRRPEPMEFLDSVPVWAKGGIIKNEDGTVGVHQLTWKHIMAPGEGYSQRLKRMAMEEMGSVADREGMKMLASTFRYSVSGNEVTFYCDARKKDESALPHLSLIPVGQIMGGVSGELSVWNGTVWIPLSEARSDETLAKLLDEMSPDE
jgi:hypothetical protein